MMTTILNSLLENTPDKVVFQITAADLLQVIRSMQPQARPVGRTITMRQAVAEYGKSEKTLTKWIKDGILRAEKVGGCWEIESKESRAERLQ